MLGRQGHCSVSRNHCSSIKGGRFSVCSWVCLHRQWDRALLTWVDTNLNWRRPLPHVKLSSLTSWRLRTVWLLWSGKAWTKWFCHSPSYWGHQMKGTASFSFTPSLPSSEDLLLSSLLWGFGGICMVSILEENARPKLYSYTYDYEYIMLTAWVLQKPSIFKIWARAALGFPMAQQVKNLPIMQESLEMQVWTLGREDPLEKDVAIHWVKL